jgi:MFS family permease
MRETFGMKESDIGLLFLFAIGLRPLWAMIGAYLAERIRPVYLLTVACLTESIAFYILGASNSLNFGIFAIILGNLGFSLWTPNLFGIIYKEYQGTEAAAKASLLNGMLNAGAAVGCLIGAGVALLDMRQIFLAAAMLYLGCLPVLAWSLWPQRAQPPQQKSKDLNANNFWAPGLSQYLGAVLATAGFWASYAQFNSFFALYAKDWLHSETFTGFAFGTLAMTVAITSIGLSKWKNLKRGLPRLTQISCVILAVAWQALSLHAGIASAMFFILALALSEAASSIAFVDLWSQLNPHRSHLTQNLNFAMRNIAMGLGSFIGGHFYQPPASASGLQNWSYVNAALLTVTIIGLWLTKATTLTPNGQTGALV